jgi:hypothetical protein
MYHEQGWAPALFLRSQARSQTKERGTGCLPIMRKFKVQKRVRKRKQERVPPENARAKKAGAQLWL